MLDAVKYFIESVWLMREAQFELLKKPLDEEAIILCTKYEMDVDMQLSILVKQEDKENPQPNPNLPDGTSTRTETTTGKDV